MMADRIAKQLDGLREDLVRAETLYTESQVAADQAEDRLRDVRVRLALGEVESTVAQDASEAAAQARAHVSELSATLEAKREAVRIVSERLRDAQQQERDRRTTRAERARVANVQACWDAWQAFEQTVIAGMSAEIEQDKQGTLPRIMHGGVRGNSVYPWDMVSYNDRTGIITFRPVLAGWAERLRQSPFEMRIDPHREHKL